MEFIDTHTHLYLPDFDSDDIQACDAVTRALKAGVSHMIMPNVGLDTVAPMQALAARHPDCVSMAMGLHPTEVGDAWKDSLERIMAATADGSSYVAVGEIGIDLYWDRRFCDQQMQAFELQLRRASELGLPVIIHCRDGLDQTLEVMQGVGGLTGVFHSFGGDGRDIDAIRRVGDFYFGINGIVTFKNSDLHRHLPAIGLERILLETDSPYLAPVPFRGRRNESARLPLIAAEVSASLGVTLAEVADRTTANARRLFGI